MCLVYFLMIPRTYTLKEQQLVSIFFFGNPAVCEIDPQEVNLTLSVPDGSSNPRNGYRKKLAYKWQYKCV